MYRVRKRLLNFRLTEEEYEQLKTASAQHGARCLSDFARSLILASLSGPAPNGVQPAENMVALDHRLSVLETAVARLMDGSPNGRLGKLTESS